MGRYDTASQLAFHIRRFKEGIGKENFFSVYLAYPCLHVKAFAAAFIAEGHFGGVKGNGIGGDS